MAPSNNENLKEKKSKFRLSNPFKPPKDAKTDVPENEQTDSSMNNLNAPAVDSTYGSTDPTPGSSTGQVPTMTEAQAAAQNAPMKTHTDGATGRTITTTTTTTTTTVTTTDGEQFEVPPGQEVVVEEAGAENNAVPNVFGPPNAIEPSELSARPISRNSQPPRIEQGPPIPPKDNRRNPSPAAQPVPFAAGALSPNYNGPSYDTATSPIGLDDSRPARQNFSYPARTPPASTTQPLHSRTGSSQYAPYQPPLSQRYSGGTESLQPPDSAGMLLPPKTVNQNWGYGREASQLRPDGKPSTLSNLKTAAAGIHGASEALRGALNASLERHTGGDEAAIAAHDGVAARGRREVETGRFVRPGAGAADANGGFGANTGPLRPNPTSVDANGGFGGNAGVGGASGVAMPADQGGPVGAGYTGAGVDDNGNADFQVKRKGLRKKLWKGKEDVR